MVNSEILFNQISGCGTLLSAGAILPSLTALRTRLLTQVTAFRDSLLAEKCPEHSADKLCRLLCCYLDIHLCRHLQQQGLNIDYPSLESGFCGAPATVATVAAIPELLSQLCDCPNEVIFSYSYALLCLLCLPDIKRTTEAAAFLARYQQRRLIRPVVPRGRPANGESLPPSLRANFGEPPQEVCLITGPCAGNWFNQYDATRSREGVLWVLAADPRQLLLRYRYVTEHYPHADIRCIVPLLGDVFKSNDLLAEQFNDWGHRLSTVHEIPSLNCLLVIYAPLSQQRKRHDPDAAYWVRSEEKIPGSVSLNGRIHALYQQLKDDEYGGDIFSVQRRLSGSVLLEWLTSSPLNTALQSLFTRTRLRLSGMLLADYGHGFPRHGAWSAWLAEKYLIYPSLSASITPLTLPPLLPLSTPIPRVCPSVVAPSPPATGYRRIHWWALLLPLLVIAMMYGGFYSLKSTQNAQQGTLITRPSPGRLLTRADAAPWFDTGSSRLLATRYQTLAALIPELQQTAQYPVLIIGYADNTGSREANRQLSLQRAQVVRDWLVINAQLPESHFILEGAGDRHPLTTDNSSSGRAENRRIEIISLYPQTFQVNKEYE